MTNIEAQHLSLIPPTPKQSDLRPSGIDGVGDLPWGSHICQFYETEQDLLEMLVSYFKAGLKNNELCLWLIAGTLTKDGARKALQHAVPGARRYFAKGCIEIASHEEWFLKANRFDSSLILAKVQDKAREAVARGFAGLRLSGNPIWAVQRFWNSFLPFERALGEAAAGMKALALCAYSLTETGESKLCEAAQMHQFSIARLGRRWEAISPAKVKQAVRTLTEFNSELERRVYHRTFQLTAANEHLSLEIASRKRAEELLDGQNRVLEMIASLAPLSESLTALVRLIEHHMPGMVGSILLLDEQGTHTISSS